MKRISNYTILFVTILGLIIIIAIGATIKIQDRHDEKLIYAVESRVEYYANRCYLEGKCDGTVTLSKLYELGYLTEITNPITKEVVDSNKEVVYEDGKYTFTI